ncbi:MAG: hypothetical protein FWE34_04930 [Defluviitaleaceae bacterium]|nr:hypothetical protein [Defluviitaleaceae bacterium]
MFGWVDILLIVVVVLGAIIAGLYFLNRWASKRVTQQQDMVERTKQSASIYVIDMKRDKAVNVTLPKVVMDNLPRTAKMMKMNFVKAKIGPQIITLMCDKTVFNALDVKKTFQVELAGIYIASVKGMKTKYELAQARKAKKLKAKQEAKATKK